MRPSHRVYIWRRASLQLSVVALWESDTEPVRSFAAMLVKIIIGSVRCCNYFGLHIQRIFINKTVADTAVNFSFYSYEFI